MGQAHDGDAAMAAARRLQPQVVLMDLRMRGFDGWRPSNASPPLTSLPGWWPSRPSTPMPPVARALQGGACGFLVKSPPPVPTVKGYVSAVLRKLGCENRAQAGLLAQQAGLTRRSDPPSHP